MRINPVTILRPSHLTQLAALALVAGTYCLVRPPQASKSELELLASRFKFSRCDVPLEHFATGELRRKHPLHPSLERICAWVSCTGA